MKWLIWSTQRSYEVEGTEEEAEVERRRQALRHQAVFKKAEDTPENRAAMRAWKDRHRPLSSAIAVAMVLFFAPPANAAALGPTNPPPGITPAAWQQMTGRAGWVARSVATLARKVNHECVFAVALELLGETERAWSEDAPGRAGAPRTVAAGREKDFTRTLKQNSEDQCGGPGGGLTGTVRGVLRFAAEQSEWQEANFERLKTDVWRAAEVLVKMGAFVPVADGAATLPAGVSLPMLNPELFMPRRSNPRDGT